MSPITPKLSRSVLYVRAHNVPRVLTFVWAVEDVCHRRLGSCCPFEITPIIMTRNSSAGTQHSLGPWFQDATKIGFLVGNNADGLLSLTMAQAHAVAEDVEQETSGGLAQCLARFRFRYYYM